LKKNILITLLITILFTGCTGSKSQSEDNQVLSLTPTVTVSNPNIIPTPAVSASNVSVIDTPSSISQATSSPTVNNLQTLPILYYHAVSDNINGIPELFVSPGEFKAQMDYLAQKGYTPINFNELPNVQNIKKPIIITFDDGYKNNFLEAYPILKSHNFKSVIFIVGNYINKPLYLNEDEIKSMSDIVQFGCHTVSHPNLTTLDEKAIEYEFSESNKIIEKISGQKPNVVAYPIGAYNQKVTDISNKFFSFGVTTQSGLHKINSDPFKIKRVYIPRYTTIDKFESRLSKGSL
jgi:peptidoglycan/xylan/chitin deacetylase (PgdA/CDA1 family)